MILARTASTLAIVLSMLAFARWAAAQDSNGNDTPKTTVDADADAGAAMQTDAAETAIAAPEPAAPDAAPPQAPMTADDGAPVGHAAPTTEAATRDPGPIRAGLEVSQYGYRNFVGPGDNRTWFHVFDVPRVHAALEGEYERARGRVVLEAARSAAEGSLVASPATASCSGSARPTVHTASCRRSRSSARCSQPAGNAGERIGCGEIRR